MPNKKTFNKQEKEEVLKSFGGTLNDQSLRILEDLKSTGKDLNKMLIKAYKYHNYC